MANEGLSFNNPNEELAHLRSKVLEQENRLEKLGIEKSRPEIIKNSIKEYKVGQSEFRTQSDHAEAKSNAVHVLTQETERQIQEMVSITEKKGILQALNTVEKMSGWTLEDDFHDYLVSLVQEGLTTRGIEAKGPIYRALNMTLFEVVLPDTASDEDRDLKTLISSMEQFYAGMLSVSEEKTLGKNYFVLEIANSNQSEEFIFYVSVPNEKKMLFEKHLLSVFPTARLIERKNDYNVFSDGSTALASVAELASPSAYSLKTYESFDYDPLNTILNSFSKIPKDGSGAAIQIIFNPQGELYTNKYKYALKRIEKGEKASDAIAERSGFGEVTHTLGELFRSEKKKDPTEPIKVDSVAIERINTKLQSPTVSTNIRIAVSGRTPQEAESIISSIESSFNQFEQPGINKFIFKRVKPNLASSFFRNFSFRLFAFDQTVPLNFGELTSIFHFHTGALSGRNELKQSKSAGSGVPLGLPNQGTLLGINRFRNQDTKVYFAPEDRLRHFYTIGQTGTGKSTLLKNMIIQDIHNGEGVCMIDPHGVDITDVLSNIPENRWDDVIYFDPSQTDRPMALNMLEFNPAYPEQKTFVVNELFSIFQKLYGKVPESMGPMFEQYFRNAAMLVIEDPESGSTLLDVSRVLSNKDFRTLKLSKCKNPIIVQFWKEVAEKAGGEGALANIVPYITSKFDVFLANDIMRPIIAQEKSSFDFREIMDNKKILLVNLSKGRLGDINANLIGLILVGKILMSALSRVDSIGSNMPPFYLYIDEFQNITTNSIATILSEARKYKLSLNIAHQYIAQLDEDIKNAVFGNVGTLATFRVGTDDAEYLEKQYAPIFTASDIVNIDNRNAYIKMLVDGRPVKPFNLETLAPPVGDSMQINILKEMSLEKYGGNRADIEEKILEKYKKKEQTL
jgi:hypothetical protein